MVYLLDSAYKLGDKHAVEYAPHDLLNMTAPQEILEQPTWNANLAKLESEMEKQLAIPEQEIDGILIKRIDTPYNIISTITRKVAWGSGKNTICISPSVHRMIPCILNLMNIYGIPAMISLKT